MDHRRHDSDDSDHHHRQRVEAQRPIDLQRTRTEPVEQPDGMRLMVERDGDEQPDRDSGGTASV